MYDNYKNVKIINHNLLKHKISLLRDKTTTKSMFRQIINEISLLLAYEATADLPVSDVEVSTPIETCLSPKLSGPDPALIPILRAGLGMLQSFETIIPTARVGFIGMARDERTHKASRYYCKLPDELHQRVVILLDPMLATGGTAADAVDLVKSYGAKTIEFVSIVAAPVGIDTLMKKHPDVNLFVGQLDRCLNDEAYICPGFGDTGDRMFGTV